MNRKEYLQELSNWQFHRAGFCFCLVGCPGDKTWPEFLVQFAGSPIPGQYSGQSNSRSEFPVKEILVKNSGQDSFDYYCESCSKYHLATDAPCEPQEAAEVNTSAPVNDTRTPLMRRLDSLSEALVAVKEQLDRIENHRAGSIMPELYASDTIHSKKRQGQIKREFERTFEDERY